MPAPFGSDKTGRLFNRVASKGYGDNAILS